MCDRFLWIIQNTLKTVTKKQEKQIEIFVTTFNNCFVIIETNYSIKVLFAW